MPCQPILPNTYTNEYHELIEHQFQFSNILEIKPFAFVMSRRNKPQLYYEGHLFNCDAVKNGRVYWRCSETRRSTCMARLITTKHDLHEKQPYHDHLPLDQRVEGKKVISLDECMRIFLTGSKAESNIEYLEDSIIQTKWSFETLGRHSNDAHCQIVCAVWFFLVNFRRRTQISLNIH